MMSEPYSDAWCQRTDVEEEAAIIETPHTAMQKAPRWHTETSRGEEAVPATGRLIFKTKRSYSLNT